VKVLKLYGSALVRIRPEIGEMAALETIDLYTSYRLHWFPFEITRCSRLRDSTVSTRALYGNYKYRPPFPPASAEHNRRNCAIVLQRLPRTVCAVRPPPAMDLGAGGYRCSSPARTRLFRWMYRAASAAGLRVCKDAAHRRAGGTTAFLHVRSAERRRPGPLNGLTFGGMRRRISESCMLRSHSESACSEG
jgi:hypothetical protein